MTTSDARWFDLDAEHAFLNSTSASPAASGSDESQHHVLLVVGERPRLSADEFAFALL